jgi:hypothetical protein
MVAYASTQDGDWSDQATWGGVGPPGDGDSATISLGDTVDIDGDITLGTNPANSSTIDLFIVGTLQWKTTAGVNWTFTMKGNVDIALGGLFEIGNETSPIPASSTATWYVPLGATSLWRWTGPGTFRTYGASAYHMADADKQRTTLAAAITLGNDKTIEFVDDVDYEVGDEVWVAKGGDPAIEMWNDPASAPLGNWGVEKITLKTKVNASTYTADFTYDHEPNDMAFSVERNVFFQCQAGKILQFYYNNYTDGTWIIDTNWTRYSPQHTGWVFYIYNNLITDNFIVKNVVFDTDDTDRASAIDFDRYVILDMRNKEIDNIHIGGFLRGLNLGLTATNDGGRVVMGNITSFSAYQPLSFKYQVVVDSLWYCAIGLTDVRPDSNYSEGFESLGGSFHFKELKIHCHAELYVSQRQLERHCVHRIDGGEVFHSIGRGIWIYDTIGIKLEVRNTEFSDTRIGCITPYSGSASLYTFEGCSFDNCARGQDTSGALEFVSASLTHGDMIFRQCTFGTNIRNKANIFSAGTGSTTFSNNRLLFEKCTFKIPDRSYAGRIYTYWPEVLYWIFYGTHLENWNDQDVWNTDRTFELIDPIVLDASDVDQWPSTFPNITHFSVAGGGTFTMNEDTIRLDGTVGAKVQPLEVYGRACCNTHLPIHVPVNDGETLTAKISFQKDTTMPAGRRPALHVILPGTSESISEMSDAINSWEEVQVVGTAALKGFARVWATVGCNEQSLTVNWRHPKIRGTRNVYIDGFSVERS